MNSDRVDEIAALREQKKLDRQAEDGIRDYDVTGVLTCALPISASIVELTHPVYHLQHLFVHLCADVVFRFLTIFLRRAVLVSFQTALALDLKIGRASCRERV